MATKINTITTTQTRTARSTIVEGVNFAELNLSLISTVPLTAVQSACSSELKSIQAELLNVEPGHLHVKKTRGKYYFAQVLNRKERGISNDLMKVHALARKEYLQAKAADHAKIIAIVDRAIYSINTVRNNSKAIKLYNRYQSAGIDPLQVFFTDAQLQWIDMPYTPNPFHSDNLAYKTLGGVPVRSKSEALFGSRLEQRGIPYRSDDMIIVSLRDDFSVKEKTYYADFKIPNMRGGISVCEHLGAFNLDSYADNSLIRLNHYVETGSVQPNELFWSFDKTVRNPEALDALINRMLLAL